MYPHTWQLKPITWSCINHHLPTYTTLLEQPPIKHIYWVFPMLGCVSCVGYHCQKCGSSGVWFVKKKRKLNCFIRFVCVFFSCNPLWIPHHHPITSGHIPSQKPSFFFCTPSSFIAGVACACDHHLATCVTASPAAANSNITREHDNALAIKEWWIQGVAIWTGLTDIEPLLSKWLSLQISRSGGSSLLA